MKSMCLYPILVSDVVEPHRTIQKAFSEFFYPFDTFDWYNRSLNIGLERTKEEFVEFIRQRKPEYTFMQLQNPANMDLETMRKITHHTKVINWTGDARRNPDWYDWFEAIGKEIFLTLFTNGDDVKLMRSRGVRADYLQVAVDHNWYYPGPSNETADIVFSAHNYGKVFENSPLREQVARTLHEAFGDRFKLYGRGWDHIRKTTVSNCKQEADAYRGAKIGISVSNLNMSRYHSDRLLRIMACGALPISHEFPDFKQDFIEGDDIVIFRSMDDLVAKCNHYLSNSVDHSRITKNAMRKVARYYTWDQFCENLNDLIDRYQ